MPRPPDLELVLAHDAFVRRLARGLVSEAERAEDLAQDTWLAALDGRPAELRSPRGWLAAAMRGVWSKRLRSEARRAQRERRAARPEATDPLDRVLEREESRRALMDALGALAEPYRTCLLLRYFEDLPPRRIARQLGVPLETVKTRLKRGREQLAARLDREFEGGRSAWSLALLPLARSPHAAALGAHPLLEMAIMSTRAKVLWGAGALLGLVLAGALGVQALRARETAAPALPAASLLAGGALAPDDRGGARELAAAPAAPGRVASATETAPPPPAAPELGSLSVRIVEWDGAPAANVRARVVLFALPSWDFHALEAVTDAEGRFTLAGLVPGRAGVYPVLGGFGDARIAAGERAEAVVELARGCDVAGEVVDGAGEPVAGADIWASTMGPHMGSVVARADAAGRFRLRCIDGIVWVGALAPGRPPSPLQTVSGGDGAEIPVRLVLADGGGEVRGRVFDAAGAPADGAVVLVGSFDPGRMDLRGWSPPAVRAVADAQGAYRVRSVAAGPCEVAVRADGHGAWRGGLEVVAGAVSVQDVYLPGSATVYGIARDAAGAPAPRVEVSVEFADALSYSALTGADGSYRLEDLPAGKLELHADGDERGQASAVVSVRPGAVLECSFDLGTGVELAGRVVDEAGEPLDGWTVELTTTASDDRSFHHGRASTDADGRFRLRNCPDHTFRVTASGSFFASLMLEGQRVPQSDLLLVVPRDRMPTCRITGRVVTKDGGPAAAATVMLGARPYNNSPIEYPDAEGRFAFDALPPALWTVRVDLAGFPPHTLEPHELHPGETWDAGAITVGEQGSLRVRLRRAQGAGQGAPQALLVALDGIPIREGVTTVGDEVRGSPLAPGRYTLSVFAAGCGAARRTFEVRDGEETAFELELVAGFPARIEVGAGTGVGNGDLSVIDASGAEVVRTWVGLQDGAGAQELWLAPGIYHVVFRTPDGFEAEGKLEVLAGAQEPARADLRF